MQVWKILGVGDAGIAIQMGAVLPNGWFQFSLINVFFCFFGPSYGFFVPRNSMIRTSKYKDFKVFNNYEEKSFKCRHSFKLVGNTFRSWSKY